MNLAHLHLLMNHLPVLGVPFGLALLCAAVIRHSDELKSAALLTFVITALFAVPVYFTGEPAEETIEDLPGVSESYIERHEDRALFSLISVAVLGTLSLVAMTPLLKNSSKPVVPLLLILAVVSTVSLGLTASAGGEIRHTEIRPSASAWNSGARLAS